MALDERQPWPTPAGPLPRACAAARSWPGDRRRRCGPLRGLPHARRPHRQPEPADQAPARHRARPGSASSASRSTAACCSTRGSTATSGSRAGSPCATAPRSTVAAGPRRPTAAAHPPARDPPRPRRQRERPDAQPAAAPRARVGPRARRPSGGFRRFVADELGVGPDDVVAWDADGPRPHARRRCSASTTSSSARRASTTSRRAARGHSSARRPARRRRDRPAPIPVICLFDHEEVGSQSATGRRRPLLADRARTRRRRPAGGRPRRLPPRRWPSSICVSADGAHATHPNYAERHEPDHQIALNGGPVLKLNSQRALRHRRHDGRGRSSSRARRAGVPLQQFVSRTDLPCGSTIGPITAARLGIPTVDVGIPQLAMHSARELCGARRSRPCSSPLLAAFLRSD